MMDVRYSALDPARPLARKALLLKKVISKPWFTIRNLRQQVMAPRKSSICRSDCKILSSKIIARTSRVLAAFIIVASPPLQAESEQETIIDGRCEYPEQIAKYRNETTLILCTKVKVTRRGANGVLEFAQPSGPPTARFAGTWSGDQMSISEVTLRNGRSFVTSGTCEIFRQNSGRIAVISCLTPLLPRSVAANFVPSRL